MITAAAAAATVGDILRGEKGGDVVVGHYEQVTRETGAKFKIIGASCALTITLTDATMIDVRNIDIIASMCTYTCSISVGSTTKSGCKPVIGCDDAGSAGTINIHSRFSSGICMSSSRGRGAVGTTTHVNSRVRGCALRGVRST